MNIRTLPGSIRYFALILTVGLMASVVHAETNTAHVNHCGDSNAANVSIQVFGSSADEGIATDSSGLLHPGQGIDMTCERQQGRDSCEAELSASDAEHVDIINRDIELEDGGEYYICADVESSTVNIDETDCDCAFVGG